MREGRAAGLTPDALRHERFSIPHHGIRRLRENAGESEGYLDERVERSAREYLPLVREGEAFSHTTALILCAAPIRCSEELHVTVSGALERTRRKGVHGHRADEPFSTWRAKSDLPIVPPTDALLQSAALLGLRELVVAIDHLILPRGRPSQRRPLVNKGELELMCAKRSARGIRKLRAALEIAREGAESRMESLLHCELARMGLDYLELQGDVHDECGRWIGRFDMVDRERKLIIEYDGEQHRTDRAQYVRNEERLERVRQAGYRILRLRKEHFYPGNIAATRRRICEFLGLDPRPLPKYLARYF